MAGVDAGDAFGALVVGFGVEGYAFEVLAAVVAEEAFWVEAGAGGGDDAPSDGEGTVLAEGAGTDAGGGPVGARVCCAVSSERGFGLLGVWKRTC